MDDAPGSAALCAAEPSVVHGASANADAIDSEAPATPAPAPAPKLRLTFKLSEIRAASSASPAPSLSVPARAPSAATLAAPLPHRKQKPQRADSEPAAAAPFATPYKRGRPKKKDGGAHSAPGAQPTSAPDSAADEPTARTADEERPGRASTRIQFPEQIAFVREMARFKCRAWRLERAALPLSAGRSLQIPCWARDKNSTTPAAARTHPAAMPTYVCTYEGCHKIFDAKDKWRRHQNLHKKKAAGLQLKLNVGMIKAAAHATSSPAGASSPRLAASEPRLRSRSRSSSPAAHFAEFSEPAAAEAWEGSAKGPHCE